MTSRQLEGGDCTDHVYTDATKGHFLCQTLDGVDIFVFVVEIQAPPNTHYVTADIKILLVKYGMPFYIPVYLYNPPVNTPGYKEALVVLLYTQV